MSTISPDIRMGAPPEPRANRLQPPNWRNPRLLIGLLLVFASITLGVAVVSAADRTIPMYAAARTLPTGTAITGSDLNVVHVRLTGAGAGYLDARRSLPAGQVLTRPVGKGELMPAGALAPASQLHLRPVSIPIEGPVPDGLSAGGLVDIWASAKAASSADSAYLDAERIAASAEVSAVDSDSRGLSASSGATVQVLLEPGDLPAVLNALANQAQVAVLPIPGEAGSGSLSGSSGASP